MAKLRAGTISTVKEKDAVSASMGESSEISQKKDKPRIGDGSKRAKISDSDILDIFNSDLNRLKERFGPVFLANTATGKSCIVLPVELGWCLRCSNVMVRNESNICERHELGTNGSERASG